jgi:hypothetical protein
MSDYDSPWKEALDYFFEAFLELFFPQAHADIDWSRGWESLDKELQQIVPEAEIGRRSVDKLVKVWLKSGQEQWVLVHFEVQMPEEAKFPWRMYVYMIDLFNGKLRFVPCFTWCSCVSRGVRKNRQKRAKTGTKCPEEVSVTPAQRTLERQETPRAGSIRPWCPSMAWC